MPWLATKPLVLNGPLDEDGKTTTAVVDAGEVVPDFASWDVPNQIAHRNLEWVRYVEGAPAGAGAPSGDDDAPEALAGQAAVALPAFPTPARRRPRARGAEGQQA